MRHHLHSMSFAYDQHMQLLLFTLLGSYKNHIQLHHFTLPMAETCHRVLKHVSTFYDISHVVYDCFRVVISMIEAFQGGWTCRLVTFFYVPMLPNQRKQMSLSNFSDIF